MTLTIVNVIQIYAIKQWIQHSYHTFIVGSQARYFAINSASGLLTMNDVIDRDGTSGISTISDVTLTVTDSAGHSVNKTLTFEIEDINDNPPVFSQWIYVINATEGEIVTGIMNC